MTDTTSDLIQVLPELPGRLGSPDMAIGDDPRADARMVAAMTPLGLGAHPEPSPVTADTPIEELLAFCLESEAGFEMMFGALNQELPQIDNVERSVETIKGVDDNDITLFIHRPTDVEGPMPAVVHTHGGGMVILKAANDNFHRWRDELAATGMVVIGVEFRNGGGGLGNHPFPAGLNDCASGVQWVHANRDALGVSTIVISGESGGGNLSIATTLKAKQEGWLDAIDGVYAQCPYISGVYATKDPALPSLYENDGYFLACDNMGALAKVYDPDGANATNPLAWPYHATVAELEGLPPHVVSVNELDPLRDEGLAYFRKLTAAGVPATSRTVNGTCHAGDAIFREALSDAYMATVRSINGFATSLE